MAPDPVTQARIYEAIKQDFLAGLLRPGSRLEIQAIADRHRTSTTPVREVLHRLEGEQLLEPRPEGGFRIAIPDAWGLRQLYDWNGRLLLTAIQASATGALREILKLFRTREIRDDELSLADWAGALFQSIGRATGNSEFIQNIRNTNERLHYVRIAEVGAFEDVPDQLHALVRNGHLDVRRVLNRRIKLFHRRRIEAADNILTSLSKMSWETLSRND